MTCVEAEAGAGASEEAEEGEATQCTRGSTRRCE